ncbi:MULTISPECIES: TetR/AcrR family transcriptional regulator [Pectobacterium]|uniref:TetR family transcriptional regulator n=4 Tax=Pectobacterium TaxID=122277 RepID=A0ABD6VIM0_9GAMM|nr:MULTISPECIES: TetR/AcrR family transcriptional regulator [Pectobacterium]KGA27076.1 TetR family transcriptional regulator [Pectobacterium odoriferum]KGA39138.1 TetR family transcriptional regulator [Pectobacterium odoriferum]KHT16843.1 TetR family transcriptional regulator [Pectobacterium carotovorum subsp. carotovorum]MBA0184663.1 TetR/AcrR family transcriptional regulator [Pectobacterium versatile]MBA0190626.1 TetR/AcrR family transcriptional regulator [Pectobacterium odoriferum]
MTTMTRERLLSEAEYLMRAKGYSAFSYADLSKIVGITKASIHHHFPTKDILGEQVVIQAFSDTQRQFEQIEATAKSAEKRIAAYVDLFLQSHRASLLPLCCALSADTANLPQNITEQTSRYFDMQIAWLTKIVQGGVDAGEFFPHTTPSDMALIIINLCEGASVVARATARPEVFSNNLKYINLLLNPLPFGE